MVMQSFILLRAAPPRKRGDSFSGPNQPPVGRVGQLTPGLPDRPHVMSMRPGKAKAQIGGAVAGVAAAAKRHASARSARVPAPTAIDPV